MSWVQNCYLEKEDSLRPLDQYDACNHFIGEINQKFSGSEQALKEQQNNQKKQKDATSG